MSIFIGYPTGEAVAAAREINRLLHDDYSMVHGSKPFHNGYFDPLIEKNIEECTDFILVLTEDIFDGSSKSVDMLLNEIKIADEEDKNIIPVLVGMDAVPENLPEPFNKIYGVESVIWSDENAPDKLKSLLKSERPFTLTVVRSGDSAALDEESREDLKTLYERFESGGVRPVKIKLKVKEPNELAELMVNDKRDQVRAGQELRHKIRWVREPLQTAVEEMIQDKNLEEFSEDFIEYYTDKYEPSYVRGEDEDEEEIFYWTPLLWIDMIEELLKELLTVRNFDYSEDKENFTAIDCVISPEGEELWAFPSYLTNNEDDENYKKVIDLIDEEGEAASFEDLPLEDKAFHVYPDFYLYLGLLKANRPEIYVDITGDEEKLDLNNYHFKLHDSSINPKEKEEE